ncbi:MAG: WecB/TagA/CpsF family glycosyltransferase [Candidatus Dormibacteraceae bacterium]
MGSSAVRILGVRVDCLDMAVALARIEALVDAQESALVATVNPELVMRACADPGFAAVLESAALCLPDGAGVVWAARRRGCAIRERVTGTDLVPALAALCARRGWPVFLLGAGPGVAELAAARLISSSPGLRVAGVHSGSPSAADDPRSLGKIVAARPKVLLVAYGAPHQELWIARHRERLGVPVAIGVGGAFDFLSGRVPRAPAWMRQAGLEWAFRLARQPWRARRMAVLPVFALRVLREGGLL